MKKRETNRFIKERRDSQGKLLCLVPICNKLRQKYKKSNKTRNYCKDHSFLDMREFTNWQTLRVKALKRDNYTCVKCGDNRREVEVKYGRTSEFKEMKTNLIADHIKPIALGGDEWDLTNIQTLCIKCNKIKTKQDIKKIAELRRKEKKAKGIKTLNSKLI